MKATLRKDGGKFVVIDPRDGKGLAGTFKAEDVLEAVALKEKIDDEIMAGSGPIVQILSKDGQPVNGIPTVKAGAAVVYTQKPSKTNKLTADKVVTESDLCDATGYVLVSRGPNGKVRSEWSGADFPKDVKLTLAGIAALQRLFTPREA